jgi:photosynthesis system II assembly factor YCF48-like protein/putative zinc finger protein
MDKDESLDRLLRRTSRVGTESHASGTCLDAETIAAWMDGALTPMQRQEAEAHAAGCDRCLSVLASLARTSPPPTTVESPRWFSFRWLVPLATAMAAVTVWIVVQRSPASLPPGQTQVASRPAELPAPPSEAEGAGDKAGAAPAAPPSAADLARRQQPPERKRSTEPSMKPDALDQAASARSAGVATVTSVAKESREAAAPAPPSSPPAPATMAQRAEADRGRVDAFRGGSPRVIDVPSPDSSVRWRIAGTTISRTSNAGGTWTEQFADTATTLAAGSSPAPATCWVVGAGGVVLLSTDGQTWRRLAFPDASADLVRVTAVDGTTATVTSDDGRVFRTADGGRTWTLQENPLAPF